MPTVPTYQRQTQTEAAAPQVANIQYSPDNFGAGLAQVADNATNLLAREKAKYDDSQLQDSVLKLNAGMQSIQTEQNQLQGQNAIGSAPAAIQKYHELAGEIGIAIPENRKRDWQRQVEGGALQLNGVTERHEFNQMQQYRQGQQQAIIANGVTSAEGLYADPVAYKLNGARTRESIQTYGQSQGWSPEEIKARQDDFTKKSALAAANALNGADYTAMIIQNGEPSDVAGSMRVPSTSTVDSHPTDGSAPRGIRNNNPGNIEFNANNEWQGQTGSDGRFAKFETPEHGIRALGKNLLSYQRQGYETPAQIITRWAPPGKDGKENDTAAYIKKVCADLGVTADQPLDLTNIDTLTSLCASIMKHENSADKVPFTPEQVSTGVQAALGFSQLDSVSRITKTPYFNELDASTQARVLQHADSMRKEQQSQFRVQTESTLKDAYAAYEQGLQPNSIPSRDQIMASYGFNKGQAVWQELQQQQQFGGNVALAKTLSPDGREKFLQSIKPLPDDGQGYAQKQQLWEKLQNSVKSMNVEWEASQATQRVASSLEKNFPLDPTDKNNQTATDNYFNSQVAPNFNINNSESLGRLATLTTRTGIIPTQIKSMMNAGATSRDPAVVVPIAKLYGQIFDNNPAAATGVDSGTMAFYTKVYSYDRAGVPADKAVDMAYNLVYQQDERTKQMVNTKLRDKDFIVARDKAAQSNINTISPGWFSGPDAQKPGTSNQLYMRDYQTIYDANFAQTGGDAQQAEAMTNAQIKSVWGVSSINGSKEVMKYAPEAIYGVNNGSGNWIPEQWEQEKEHLKAASFGGSRDDTDLIIVADALTPRDNSYSVMVKQRNADGFDDISSYHGASGLPVRFKPDQKTSPMYQRVMLLQQKGVDEARAKRIGAPINESDNYLNSGQLHKEAQQNTPITNMPSNMIVGGK